MLQHIVQTHNNLVRTNLAHETLNVGEFGNNIISTVVMECAAAGEERGVVATKGGGRLTS